MNTKLMRIGYGLRKKTEVARMQSMPSVRVPVTPENRSYLRWIRSVELEAWREGGGTACQAKKARG